MKTYPFSAGSLIVTSISGPNAILKALADGASAQKAPFIVVGDSKSPADFNLDGCDFYGLDRQRKLAFAYAAVCPERSYTRKNIGYLLAVSAGAEFIVETDDDNFPFADFWGDRTRLVNGDLLSGDGWANAYAYFSDSGIYPRGFPLEKVRHPDATSRPRTKTDALTCPIQQGLADRNPDVDAIYRMLYALPVDFQKQRPLILDGGVWCPYNSQNTTTFREAFPLLYLPAHCSFRMTDIWRSFVAQRIAWTCGWKVSFHSSTVYQERNEHDLLRDFADEVPGYLHNARIATTLTSLDLAAGPENIESNMLRCYEALIKLGVVGADESRLLSAWFDDLGGLLPVS